jgi:hypothetical protein
MSKRRPKHIFRERRPASCRLESPESVAFRGAMYEEHRREAVQERFGFEAGDEDELMRLADWGGSIAFGGEPYLVLEPRRAYDDHADFDSAVCRAGLKRFVRPRMDSDWSCDGIPIDPETGKPDPTITRPQIDEAMPPYTVVVEVRPGIRARRGIAIEWNDSGVRQS